MENHTSQHLHRRLFQPTETRNESSATDPSGHGQVGAPIQRRTFENRAPEWQSALSSRAERCSRVRERDSKISQLDRIGRAADVNTAAQLGARAGAPPGGRLPRQKIEADSRASWALSAASRREWRDSDGASLVALARGRGPQYGFACRRVISARLAAAAVPAAASPRAPSRLSDAPSSPQRRQSRHQGPF